MTDNILKTLHRVSLNPSYYIIDTIDHIRFLNLRYSLEIDNHLIFLTDFRNNKYKSFGQDKTPLMNYCVMILYNC